ncbi:MAG: 30S ribosome-binding factor RbfA [Gammaproteobacteria bacterium]|nr:30S ribosome-binding factor RbfA [Gammaproteobacteria bacterium]
MAPGNSQRGDGTRPRRIGEVIRRGLAEVLRQDFEHRKSAYITLTAVDVSPDLRNARVFFTLIGKDSDPAEIVKDLNRASGYLRHCLRDKVDLRGLPKLVFEYDVAVEHGSKMEDLFNRIHHDDKPDQ